MNVIKKLLAAAALLLGVALTAQADGIENFNDQQVDIEVKAAQKWITESTKNRIEPVAAKRIAKSVMQHAQRTGIDVKTILAVIKNESTFNYKAKSPYGAVGLMQVVPRWHRDKINGRDITKIETNIEVGTTILMDCWNSSANKTAALACYSGQSVAKVGKYKAKINSFSREYIQFKKDYLSTNGSQDNAVLDFYEVIEGNGNDEQG